LHHLDLSKAGAELKRVMRPGGVAVFCEPWGGNPLLEFARNWLPYPGKHRTADERPLRDRDLAPLREHFPALRVQGFQLLGMVGRAFRRRLRSLEHLDAGLIRLEPRLGNWCRYVVLTLPRG
jgi:SAM-dependent methyltransferase